MSFVEVRTSKSHLSPTSVMQPQLAATTTIEPLMLDVGSKIHARCNEPSSAKRSRCQESEWVCPVSKKARQTVHPTQVGIDQIVRRIRPSFLRRDKKRPISLASGDPTAAKNLQPCHAAIETVSKALLESPHAAGYSQACGIPAARQAIAKHHSHDNVSLKAENVIVTSGASGALELALKTLLDPESTVLVPQPGFPLYEEIASSIGAKVVHYRLDMQHNWECDLEYLESLMLSATNVRAIVVNNPSSPTGSVFSEHHLTEILQFARKHRLPILADEVYGDLTYGSNVFHPMARVAAKMGRFVPVLTVSGISKQFLLPGWRIGWLCFHDNKYETLRHIRRGAIQLAEMTHGPSCLPQAALPTILDESTPGIMAWKNNINQTLQNQAEALCSSLRRCPGLSVMPPRGAFFTTAKIDTSKLAFENDVEFCMRLVDEENVFVLPGSAMGARGVFRVAFCSPESVLEAAGERIQRFCWRHLKTHKTKR